MVSKREVRDDQHGTLTGYAYGCRCHKCTAASRERYRQWRRDNPEKARESNRKSSKSFQKRARDAWLSGNSSFAEVQLWANSLGFDLRPQELKSAKGKALVARYDREHPDRPYRPLNGGA